MILMTLDEKKRRAESLEKAGNYAEAVNVWREIVAASPDANSSWKYGQALMATEQFEAAITAYRETIKLLPSSAVAWGALAAALQKAGKTAEAEKAALQALRFDPDYLYAYRLLQDIYGQSKNWAAQIAILGRLHATGKATDYDLNCLGIAHANLKQHGDAIRFYRLASRLNPTVYPHFNVGLTFEQLGQRLDALDAFQESLRIDPQYEAAKKACSRIQPALIDLEKRLTADHPVLPKGDWFLFYINPFELLGADRDEDITAFDVKKLAGLKKRLLHGIALDDGKVEALAGHTIDASVVEDAYKDLLDETKRTYHWTVFRDEKLLRFLTRCDLRHFLYQDGQTPFGTLDKISSDEDFRLWLSELFAKQYNHVLGSFMKSSDATAVEALLDGRRWTLPEHDDICFDRAHRQVAEMIAPLEKMGEQCKKQAPQFEEIRELVIGDANGQERIKILSKLPIQFREQINEVITSIRTIAIDCHNMHEQSALSYEILKITRRLPIRDLKLRELLSEDISAIEKIIKEDAAHRFEALIRKDTMLRVSKKGVEYGGNFVRAQDVRTLAWGIYIHRVNGVETQHNYSIDIGTLAGSMHISWNCDGLIVGLAKKVLRDKNAIIPVSDKSSTEQDGYFGKIVDAIFHNIATVLLAHIMSQFEAGHSVKIGNCTLSKRGAAFQTGLIFKDDHLIPWNELDTGSGNGQITLYHTLKRSIKISFTGKGTPNAVILPALCRVLKK